MSRKFAWQSRLRLAFVIAISMMIAKVMVALGMGMAQMGHVMAGFGCYALTIGLWSPALFTDFRSDRFTRGWLERSPNSRRPHDFYWHASLCIASTTVLPFGVVAMFFFEAMVRYPSLDPIPAVWELIPIAVFPLFLLLFEFMRRKVPFP